MGKRDPSKLSETVNGIELTPAQHAEHARRQHQSAKLREEAEEAKRKENEARNAQSSKTTGHAGEGEALRLGGRAEEVEAGPTPSVRPRHRKKK